MEAEPFDLNFPISHESTNIKMTYMRTLFLAVLMAFGTLLTAQDGPDAEEMALFQSVLTEWMNNHNPAPGRYRLQAASQKPFYNPEFGMVVPTPTYVSGGSAHGFSNVYVTPGRVGSAVMVSPNVSVSPSPSPTPDVRVGRVVTSPTPPSAVSAPAPESPETGDDELQTQVEDILKEFLASYGDLVDGVEEEERIMLTYGTQNQGKGSSHAATTLWEGQGVAVLSAGGNTASDFQMTVEVLLKEVISLRRGEIDEEKLMASMKVSVTDVQNEVDPAYSILANLLSKQMTDLSHEFLAETREDEDENEWFFAGAGVGAQNLSFQLIEGYGVIYQAKLRASFRMLPERCNCPEDEEKSEDAQLRWDTAVDNLRDQLEESVPELLVKYGRTLRQLPAGGWLELKVILPGCKDCSAPAAMVFKVPQATLKDYDTRSLSLDSAADRVIVSEEGEAQNTRMPGLIFMQGQGNQSFEFDFDYEEGEEDEEDEE